MGYSLNEQKRFLSENLVVESLREKESNQEDIKNFVQATNGDRISNYLINNAWDDDHCRNTRVFLVRDKNTKQVVFYYALNCGILYTDFKPLNLTSEEKPIVENYINAIKLAHKKNLTPEEQEYANNAYAMALSEFSVKIDDVNRVTTLISMAEERANLKEEKEEALKETAEDDHIKQVKETFPAIDIKFLCRNAQYHPPIKLDFKLGVYIFWEIIVPHILKISDMVGCKYVYLFAADNTEIYLQKKKAIPMWTPDYDPDDEDEPNEGSNDFVRKLVSYYITELKFRQVSEYTILKPHFERTCYTLIQEVASLQEKRELVWASHDANNEIDSY